jgi:hypothetical protein
VGVECGGLGRDPPVVSVGRDAGQGDRAGAGVFEERVVVPTRRAEDLYAGWWPLLEQLGAVPWALVWDGEGAVGRWRPRQPLLIAACHGFHGVLGAKVLPGGGVALDEFLGLECGQARDTVLLCMPTFAAISETPCRGSSTVNVRSTARPLVSADVTRASPDS